MHRKVQSINDGCDGEHIKCLHVLLIAFLVVEHEDLIAEVEMLSHISRLVISTQHDDIVGALELQAEKVGCDFRTIVASINIVTQEEHLLVASGARAAFNLAKHGDKIVELAVDVANDDDFTVNTH